MSLVSFGKRAWQVFRTVKTVRLGYDNIFRNHVVIQFCHQGHVGFSEIADIWYTPSKNQ